MKIYSNLQYIFSIASSSHCLYNKINQIQFGLIFSVFSFLTTKSPNKKSSDFPSCLCSPITKSPKKNDQIGLLFSPPRSRSHRYKLAIYNLLSIFIILPPQKAHPSKYKFAIYVQLSFHVILPAQQNHSKLSLNLLSLLLIVLQQQNHPNINKQIYLLTLNLILLALFLLSLLIMWPPQLNHPSRYELTTYLLLSLHIILPTQ